MSQIPALSLIKFTCLFSTVLALLWFAGFRLNVTASLPLGLYRLTNEVPQKGSIAFFCLESPEFRSLAKERDYVGSGFCAVYVVIYLLKGRNTD